MFKDAFIKASSKRLKMDYNGIWRSIFRNTLNDSQSIGMFFAKKWIEWEERETLDTPFSGEECEEYCRQKKTDQKWAFGWEWSVLLTHLTGNCFQTKSLEWHTEPHTDNSWKNQKFHYQSQHFFYFPLYSLVHLCHFAVALISLPQCVSKMK